MKYSSRDVIEFGAFAALGVIVRLLPLRVAQRFGRRLGEFIYTTIKIRREITYQNLRAAFPEKTMEELDGIALEAYCNFAINFIEMFWLPRMNHSVLLHVVKVRNGEVFQEIRNRGKGYIMISGHFGNWELFAFSICTLFNSPSLIIAQNQRNPLVNALLNKYRSLCGNRIVAMERSVQETLRALHQGQGVLMLADQSAPRERIYIDFFGRPAATFEGPAVFALRSGAPIVMAFLIRQKNNTYELVFEELSTTDLHEATEENIHELTKRHVKVLERYIREYPGQWLWLHKRWKHTEYALSHASEETVNPESK
ncbi:MAG: lysophospholipid acyltransferase family protein [Bacteroidota bacterium]